MANVDVTQVPLSEGGTGDGQQREKRMIGSELAQRI